MPKANQSNITPAGCDMIGSYAEEQADEALAAGENC